MIGYKLTNAQKDKLVGQQFDLYQFFNPVTDINGVYFIFEGEVENCVNEEFMWVKELPEAEYVPPIVEQSLIK
jgi:hypothetical protein